jgi:hypothetical protein
MTFTFNASSEVSNYEYNSLVDKYNKLYEKHNKLIDDYNELVFDNIMATLTKFQLDGEIIDIAIVSVKRWYGNRCLLGSEVYGNDGQKYSISFNFEEGIGWSKPSSFRDSIKIDGTTPGVMVITRPENKIKELQRIFIDKDLREELVKMFRQLHKECYTS